MIEKPKLNSSLRVLFLSLGMVSLFLAIFVLDDLGIWEDLSFVGTVLGVLGIFVGLFPNLVPIQISWQSLVYTMLVVGLGYFVFPVEYEGWTKKWLGSKVYRHIATGMGFAPGEKLGVIRLDPSQEKEMVFLRGKVPDYFILSRSHTYQNGQWSDNESVVQDLTTLQSPKLAHSDFNLWFADTAQSTPIFPVGIKAYQYESHSYLFQQGSPLRFLNLAPDLTKDLQVPTALQKLLRRELAQNCPNTTKAFDVYKCLMQYFNTKYTYSYELDLKSTEPLEDFIREKKGYCAYFASLSVLMFRSHGVPARFVEGLAYPELVGRDYFVLRNRNAHSWVEFWNGKAWILMDPTPVALDLNLSKSSPHKGIWWIAVLALGALVLLKGLHRRKNKPQIKPITKSDLALKMAEFNLLVEDSQTLQDWIALVENHPEFEANRRLLELKDELLQLQNQRYVWVQKIST